LRTGSADEVRNALIARQGRYGGECMFRFDIVLQGEAETVFPDG